MKRFVLALAVVVGGAFAATPSWATTVPLGALSAGNTPVSDEQKSALTSDTIDYTFSLGAASLLSVNAGGPLDKMISGKKAGLSSLSLNLLDSTNTVIATVGSAALGGSLLTGLSKALAIGSYTLQIIAGHDALHDVFDVTTTLTVNPVAATPIPATALLLLTAVGGLGGLAFRRKRAADAA